MLDFPFAQPDLGDQLPFFNDLAPQGQQVLVPDQRQARQVEKFQREGRGRHVEDQYVAVAETPHDILKRQDQGILLQSRRVPDNLEVFLQVEGRQVGVSALNLALDVLEVPPDPAGLVYLDALQIRDDAVRPVPQAGL